MDKVVNDVQKMTKEQFENLYRLVTSSNIDDVHLGMELVNNLEMKPMLFSYIWLVSKCFKEDLEDWGLYTEMTDKLDAFGEIGSPHELTLQQILERYVE